MEMLSLGFFCDIYQYLTVCFYHFVFSLLKETLQMFQKTDIFGTFRFLQKPLVELFLDTLLATLHVYKYSFYALLEGTVQKRHSCCQNLTFLNQKYTHLCRLKSKPIIHNSHRLVHKQSIPKLK